jgi:hypothetical protein
MEVYKRLCNIPNIDINYNFFRIEIVSPNYLGGETKKKKINYFGSKTQTTLFSTRNALNSHCSNQSIFAFFQVQL